MAGVGGDPLQRLWLVVHDIWRSKGPLGSREIARRALKIALNTPGLQAGDVRTHSRVNLVLKTLRQIDAHRRAGQSVADGIPGLDELPGREVVRTVVLGLDPGRYTEVNDLWTAANESDGSAGAQAPTREPAPPTGSIFEALAPGRAARPAGPPEIAPGPVEPDIGWAPAPVPVPEYARGVEEPHNFAALLAAHLGGPPDVFDAQLHPFAMWEALQKTLHDIAGRYGEGAPAPDRYLLQISPEDYQSDERLHDPLRAALTVAIAAYAVSTGLRVDAPIAVELEDHPGIDRGTCRPRYAWSGDPPAPPTGSPDPPPPTPPTPLGPVLAPSLPGYRDLTVISEGGSSVVYRAVQSWLDRTVAIKVLVNAVTTNTYVRERDTTAKLSAHPNIVTIFDNGTTDEGDPYIVMQYCPDGSYAHALGERGRLPAQEVVAVGVAIAEALHAAHEAGIIHRDVKPSNILRSRHGPLLTDFGIARAPQDLHRTSSIHLMTPNHASPEALTRGTQSPASDVYGLASTLWELLVGWPPFADPAKPFEDLQELCRRVLNEPPPEPPVPAVPPALWRELRRALAKRPDDRHPSARAFALALKR